MNSSNSAAFSGHLCCKHNLCGVPSSSLHSPSWQGLLLSSLWLPSKWERTVWLKSCLCQALICCRLCRALYASICLRCNESSINYCVNNAPLIWMLSVLWKQQPSKALLSTSSRLKHLDKPCGNLNLLLEKIAPSMTNPPWLEQTHPAPLCLSPHTLVAHRKGMIAGSMLGNMGITGAIPSDPFLWCYTIWI